VLIAALLAVVIGGCGYSEDQWQAQLGKYGQLDHKYHEEREAHERTKKELAQVKQRVTELQAQLEKSGVDLSALNQQLLKSGTERQQLVANLSELKQALEEYKLRADQLERIKQRFEILQKKLQKLVNMGLKVEIRRNRMVIRLPGDVLFPSGQDTLRSDGEEVLNAVAEVIRNDKQLAARYFQIAGHTDNKPIKGGGRFNDNWALSLMRARRVLLYLIAPVESKEGGGLDAQRLHAAGYGDTDPVSSNDTEDGRKQNRRVELVLLPDVEEMLDLKSLI
jgi:chemotaxis protein MotB